MDPYGGFFTMDPYIGFLTMDPYIGFFIMDPYTRFLHTQENNSKLTSIGVTTNVALCFLFSRSGPPRSNALAENGTAAS